MKTAIELIAEERQRQIEEEGWSPEHDSFHTEQELAIAAACYAYPNYDSNQKAQNAIRWPWMPEFWKPTPDDRIRELVKAGALIAAEIDRLQRKEIGNEY